MAFSRHPLLRFIWFIMRGLFFLLTIPWVRKQAGKRMWKSSAKQQGKVVDAKGSVVDEEDKRTL